MVLAGKFKQAMHFDDFEAIEFQGGESTVFARRAGQGPPVVLLHGFPQTHLMWRGVAPRLARTCSVVCADLRGYGRSGCPPSRPDHSPYSKRALAMDIVELMAALGFSRFAVAGHDRGGRVAFRLALDHPERITRLAALDIVPTEAVWRRADARFSLAYWPWSLLAQPEPFPEQVLLAAADAVIENAMTQWGSTGAAFPAEIRTAYADVLRATDHAHAICEEYRAAAGIDREHDARDLEAGRRIRCPVQALWSARGALASWYENEGGPLALWREWAEDVRGGPIEGGHFFPEESPEITADALHHFFVEESDR